MLTLFYERVSTDQQSESGLGLESQHRRNLGVAQMIGRTHGVSGIYEESAVSAAVPFRLRPKASLLMQLIENRLDHPPNDIVVIAYSLDRLFRDVDDGRAMLRWFDERGVRVILSNEGGNAIDTSTAMGRFLITIRLAQGELERGLTGERTKAALGVIKARGGKLGEAPYGWTAVGNGAARHLPNPEEQAVIAEILDLAAGGNVNRDGSPLSLRQIAQTINNRGHLTRECREWTHVQIARILQRAEEAE